MIRLTEESEDLTIPAINIFYKVFNVLHPDSETNLFLTCEVDGDMLEVTSYDDKERLHIMKITYEVVEK